MVQMGAMHDPARYKVLPVWKHLVLLLRHSLLLIVRHSLLLIVRHSLLLKIRLVHLLMLSFGLFFVPRVGKGQNSGAWKLDLYDHFWPKTVYFLDLPGPPRIGFVGPWMISSHPWKTTDGGKTWKEIPLSSTVRFVNAFTFKDSLVGWLAAEAINNTEAGYYKTTDGGETWNVESTHTCAYNSEVYYQRSSRLLFASPWMNDALVSSDDGATWRPVQAGRMGFLNSIAFSTDSVGLWSPQRSTQWWGTFDAGRTWSELPFGSECHKPLAIKGTTTFFAISDSTATVYRTDDAGATWRSIYTFPFETSTFPSTPYVFNSGDIEGNLCRLFVQLASGVYMSLDSGKSWQSLRSPSSNLIYDQTFYVKDHYLYTGTFDYPNFQGWVWMLDLDSLYPSPAGFRAAGSDGSARETLQAGDTLFVKVGTSDTLNSNLWVDGLHVSFRYDPNELWPIDFTPGAGWMLGGSSIAGDSAAYTVVPSDSSANIRDVGTLRFASALSSTTQTQVTSRTEFLGHWKHSECSTQSSISDSSVVAVTFTGCGDSLLAQAMSGGHVSISDILVQPNPQRSGNGALRVSFRLAASEKVSAAVMNLSGTEIWSSPELVLEPGARSFDIPTRLSSGIYFLELRTSSGERHSTRFVIEK